MCAIIGSFNRNRFLRILDANMYRGGHSYSLFSFSVDGYVYRMYQGFGTPSSTLVHDLFDTLPITYVIGHVQAPTTDARTVDSIHPAVSDAGSMLWHNGIIKTDFISHMQQVMCDTTEWDTALLNRWIDKGYGLDSVDGSFACVRYENNTISMFRNELSPLFYSGELDISSHKIDGMTSLVPGAVVELDLPQRAMLVTGKTFKTANRFFADLDDL